MTDWNQTKEERVLRRYHFLLTFRILRIALILFFIYVLYSIIISIGYNYSSKGNKLNAYAQLAIDWQYPGVLSEFTIPNADISPLLTQTTSVPMIHQVGRKEETIGEFQVRKPLFTGLTDVQYEFYHKRDRPNFDFWLPSHPETGAKSVIEDDSTVWETLGKIHQGTVADLAFSTKEFLSPEEIFTLLTNYDLEVKWMPIYMGEFKLFTENWYGNSESIAVDSWGLTEGKQYDDNYQLISNLFLARNNVEENQKLMIENMKKVYQDDPKLAEKVFNTSHFEERIQFLEDNGFMVYGAVVTGPSKELLKLKELNEIGGVQLGKVQLWNW